MPKIVLRKRQIILEFSVALLLILIGGILRFIPHSPNFTPIAAIALFGGVYFSRKIAFVLPLLIISISDFFIGYYAIGLMAGVYGSFLLCVVLGFWLKKHTKWHIIAGSSVLCAILFFIITNFAVWVFTPWYAKTFSGLMQCYLMALPFFKNTLLGNLFYVTVFFGAHEMARVWVRKKFTITETTPITIS